MTSVTLATSDRLQSRGGRITVRSGADEGKSLDIGIEPRLIGRHDSCHLVVRDSKISSIHVEMVATDRGVRMRDLGSRNGTWLGGARVLDALLTERTSLWLGETEVEFEPSLPKRVQLRSEEMFGPMYGASAQMRAIFERVAKVAATDLSVLILGETGTGKEIAAKAIHQVSARKDAPFVVIDCGCIVHTLAEATLFGHERGAFTGADKARVSPFLQADGGTVFLDEIGELPLDTQPKLLRALAEQRIKPVGASQYVPINVRVIAATRADLTRAVNQGRFRSDLFFRIAQLAVTLPPLRERRDDIPGLARHKLRQLGHEAAFRRIPGHTFERLIRHDWPGNVRELHNAVEVAFALAGSAGPVDVAAQIGAESRPQVVLGGFRPTRKKAVADFERRYFEQLGRQCENNVSEMARRSGLERSHVRRYLKKLGMREPGQ